MRKGIIASLSVSALFAGAAFSFFISPSEEQTVLAQSCPAGQQEFKFFLESKFPNEPVPLPHGIKKHRTIYKLLDSCFDKSCSGGAPDEADKKFLQSKIHTQIEKGEGTEFMTLDMELAGWSFQLCCAKTDAEALKRMQWHLTLLKWANEAAPNIKWAYYAKLPVALSSSLSDKPTDPKYKEWQHRNELLKPLMDASPALFPNYYAYTVDPAVFVKDVHTRIGELKRIVPGKPVYMFISPKFHPQAENNMAHDFIPKEYFLTMLKGVRDAGGQGVVIWAWDMMQYPWSEVVTHPWWQAILEFQKGSNCVPGTPGSGSTPPPPDTTPPSAPGNLTASSPSPFAIQLKWSAGKDMCTQ